jgi:nucleotide-binding universal stress UspA family protein
MARLRRLLERPPLGAGRRRVRTARRLAGRHQTVVVPLLDRGHTRHALDLACQLASERRSRVLVLAPLYVEWELPLNAHFQAEEAALRAELRRERALAESYGVSARGEIVRARPGELGRGVAAAAREVGASLIVIGAAAESRPGFDRPFSSDVWSVLIEAPSAVMIATGPRMRAAGAAA